MDKRLKSLVFSVVIIAVVVIAGLILTSSHGSDVDTLNNMKSIAQLVSEYYSDNSKLPSSLSDLGNTTGNYEYQTGSGADYKLCTNFNDDSNQNTLEQAGINAQYKKGYDCISFNAAVVPTGTESDTTSTTHELQQVNLNLDNTQQTGIDANNVSIQFDTSKSLLFLDKSTNKYLLNFYATISSVKNCNTNTAQADDCCYSLSNFKIISNGGSAVYNQLGTPTYVKPFPDNTKDTFGDLPTNFCFQGSNSISGGISFLITKETITDHKLEFSLSVQNKGNTSLPIKISGTLP